MVGLFKIQGIPQKSLQAVNAKKISPHQAFGNFKSFKKWLTAFSCCVIFLSTGPCDNL